MLFSRWSSIAFDPAQDIPDLAGKVALVTGGNGGLGQQSILELCRHNISHVWLTSRNVENGATAIGNIRRQIPGASIDLLELDLTSLESVGKAAKLVLESSTRLDILLLNAGMLTSEHGLTREGYELQFGANYVGHALLVRLLLPLLLKTAAEASDARIVSLSSMTHRWAPKGGIDFDTLRTTAEGISMMSRHAQSKLATNLLMHELARRYPALTTVSVHPGAVRTNISISLSAGNFILQCLMSLLGQTAEKGARNQLWACTASEVKSGEYYEPIGVAGKESALAKDATLSKTLWEWTDKELDSYVRQFSEEDTSFER